MKYVIILALMFSACNAPLNGSGKHWKDVKHRMFARRTCHCEADTTFAK